MSDSLEMVGLFAVAVVLIVAMALVDRCDEQHERECVSDCVEKGVLGVDDCRRVCE